jgi:hypothetical protein
VSNLRVKMVFRRDEIQGHYRLFRIMWERGIVGDGRGHSNMVSVALQPKLLGWSRGDASWMIVFWGVRVHRKRSFGGIFA